MAALAFAASASAETVYDNAPASLEHNVPSQPFQAQGTSEFGTLVKLAGADRSNPSVKVVMSVWSCEHGDWTLGCTTTPGAKFTEPITLNVYKMGPGNSIGELIGHKTETFQFYFRPTSSPGCPTEGTGPGGAQEETRFEEADGTCDHGKLEEIEFHLAGVTLPDEAIVSVAYDTETWGYEPKGYASAADALNVALMGPSSVGSNPLEEQGIFWASKTYADHTGVFGFQSEPNEWTGYQPAFSISASPAEAPAGPAGATGATGATGPAGPAGSSETIALKRKMSVNVVKSSVQLNGGVAPVLVRCTGSVLQRCVGTLTLKAKGTVQKAAYSVLRGKTATVSVPLSNALRVKTESSAGGSTVARAVTRTEQSSGRPFRTSRKLHLH